MDIVKYTVDYVTLANSFDCGNIIINKFLKSGDALDKNQGITYVMLSEAKDFIIGYYNICAGRVDRVEIIGEEKFYEPMGGSVNINYLAIHSNFQRTQIAEYKNRKIYLGDYILRDCEKRILRLRKEIGVAFVTLNSTKEGYHLYHERNSYEDFDEDMSTFVQKSDVSCYKLYKWVDDIVGA